MPQLWLPKELQEKLIHTLQKHITILIIILLLTTRKLSVLSGTHVNFTSSPSQNQ
ncbi:hypothetical protein Hanom_Chr08g00711161 [Helianthus anomalus]